MLLIGQIMDLSRFLGLQRQRISGTSFHYHVIRNLNVFITKKCCKILRFILTFLFREIKRLMLKKLKEEQKTRLGRNSNNTSNFWHRLPFPLKGRGTAQRVQAAEPLPRVLHQVRKRQSTLPHPGKHRVPKETVHRN